MSVGVGRRLGRRPVAGSQRESVFDFTYVKCLPYGSTMIFSVCAYYEFGNGIGRRSAQSIVDGVPVVGSLRASMIDVTYVICWPFGSTIKRLI